MKMSKTDEQADQIAPQGDATAAKLVTNKSQRRRIWKILTRDLFFFVLVAILAFLALLLAWPYLSPILLALATVVIVKPLYNWFLKRRWLRGNTKWAAIITIIAKRALSRPAYLEIAQGLVEYGYLDETDLELE